MSFINQCNAIIRRYNKDMFYMNLGKEGLYYNYYDSNDSIVHRDRLISYKGLDFTKYNFSMDTNDNIYCIYCSDTLQILQCKRGSNIFLQKEAINYNYKKFGIIFPHVKYIGDNAHVFYYVCNNSSPNMSALFHHYNDGEKWSEYKIDFINHIILDNFIVLWNDKIPTVFYFNLVNGCEEVFSSRFNLGTYAWSAPLQITNSGKNKLYLNVIRDNLNFYHLTFIENQEGGYVVKYLNGYLNENKFSTENSAAVSSSAPCMYPSLLKDNNNLIISWVEFNRLYSVKSSNSGKTWGEPLLSEESIEDDFCRAIFYSNYEKDTSYKVNHVFSTLQDIGILGI